MHNYKSVILVKDSLVDLFQRQYEFLYNVLYDGIRVGRTAVPCHMFTKHMAGMRTKDSMEQQYQVTSVTGLMLWMEFYWKHSLESL